MGINCSRITNVGESVYAQRLCSKDSISVHDPLWNQLFSFTFSLPTSREESIELEQITESFCKMLFENNQRTAAFSTLIGLFLSRASELNQSVDCEDKIFIWQTCNSLFIIRHLCKFAVENMSEEKLMEQFEARSLEQRKADLETNIVTSLEEEEKSVNLSRFLRALMCLLSDLQINEFTYSLHLEALKTFLILLSPQLFLLHPSHVAAVSRIIYRDVDKDQINIFMKTLLQNVVDRKPAPKRVDDVEQRESIVIGIASVVVNSFKNVITFGGSKEEDIEDIDAEETIARQSSLLILALAMQKSEDQDHLNPFQQSLSTFRHIQGPQRMKDHKISPPSFHINLSRLYTTVCQQLTSELTTLLLYNLLHQNSDVRAFILSKIDVETLVVPILRVLYSAPHHNSHHIYMSLIILLILTEDNHFNKSVYEVPMHTVPWYTDRVLHDVSLGDVIILVLIRTIQFNISQMRDQYLHTNCLAALANMSSHFKKLHHYSSQRIFGMLTMLVTKMQKLRIKIKESEISSNQQNEDEVHIDVETHSSLDVNVVEEITRMLLEIINACLTGNALRNNANLIYALLQSRSTFDKLKSFDNFQDVLQNIETLLAFFDARLDDSNHVMSSEEVHDFIRQTVVQLPTHRLQKHPELKFRYVEEDQPEEFFVPYIWSLIFNKSGIFWNPGCVQLFSLD